jgi:hypothetical protein
MDFSAMNKRKATGLLVGAIAALVLPTAALAQGFPNAIAWGGGEHGSRNLCTANCACCSEVLIGTNGVPGREAASHTAAASFASLLRPRPASDTVKRNDRRSSVDLGRATEIVRPSGASYCRINCNQAAGGQLGAPHYKLVACQHLRDQHAAVCVNSDHALRKSDTRSRNRASDRFAHGKLLSDCDGQATFHRGGNNLMVGRLVAYVTAAGFRPCAGAETNQREVSNTAPPLPTRWECSAALATSAKS